VETISWQDFEQVDLRAGTIVTTEVFPAYQFPPTPPSTASQQYSNAVGLMKYEFMGFLKQSFTLRNTKSRVNTGLIGVTQYLRIT
jgi:hypothetical protein